MKKIVRFFLAIGFPTMVFSQNAKVQTAYRNVQDYDNSKDVSSLIKAKEAIDMATTNDETKDKAKTWVYRAKVYYSLFKNDLDQAEKKVPATITNKNERLTQAYGNVSTANYEEAGKAMEKAVSLDKNAPQNYAMELGTVGMGMMNDVNNLAIGKYNVKNYKEAMDFFEASYESAKMMGRKDTNQLTNALICAQNIKDTAKIIDYNQKAINEKVATAYNYMNLYYTQLGKKDTANALKTLQAGRTLFPNDADLMNSETDYLMSTGKTQEALANLDKAIAQTPNNAKLYVAKGITYQNMANPKDPATRKDIEKPKNYDELTTQAETNFKKATELDPKFYEAWYNLGVVYNNWSSEQMKRCDDLIKQATKLKECEAKTTDMNNKAIAAFEKAVELNPSDTATKKHLKRLYLITNQPDKAEKIGK